MKTIVEINNNNYGSTGNIMLNIAKQASIDGFKVYISCRKSIANSKNKYNNQIYIGTWIDRIISERLSLITGLNGYFNIINTWLFLNKLNSIKPDIIHIHSLCDNYINVSMLFKYIKKNNIKTVWTLHDNWAFTGRCAQFRCENWMNGCGKCPHLNYFPKTLFFDNSKHVWKKRKKLYNDLKTLTIVTPSIWLKNLVNKSLFNNHHNTVVINNGINLDIFKPTSSYFREKYNLYDKFIILGVANFWDGDCGKGLEDFVELSKRLPNNFQIVLVGTNEISDKEIPSNIISIHRTSNQKELVEIYSAADLFVNPTIDDNFPTVNMESIACGTPILTYNTGGSAEIIDNTCGNYVNQKDIDKLEKEIIRIYKNHPYSREACLTRAKKYEMHSKFKEYSFLFKNLLNELN